jgi:menaquinone-9 beta-reductase
MLCCDVLIIGAGPAGMAAAIALRQRGADVLVADALRPPIDKPCGEGLMPEAVRELSRLGVPLDSGHGAPFLGIAFVSDTTHVAADFSHGTGFGIRRTVLHRLLLERALQLGVRFVWNTPAALRVGKPLILGNTSCVYGWLIGADGQASRVRAWAGLERGSMRSRRFGFRAHYRLDPGSYGAGETHVAVHWGTLGQAYLTPIGHGAICVSAMTRLPRLRMHDILASIPSLRGRYDAAAPATEVRGYATLVRQFRHVTSGRVALIGDASGCVDAITGEGLALAFRQGSLIAEALTAGSPALYERSHAALLALPRRMSALLLLLDRLPELRRRTLDAFSANPMLFREFLDVHVGDQSLRQFVLRHGAALGAGMLAPRVALASDPIA